ncbi:hypothetical protein VCHA38O209_80179 [Vibrio chagasii]|nr:hypothetical protein VCHA38O209_80179 [Vibrio chagasii]
MVVHNTDFLGDIVLDRAERSTIGIVVLIRQEGESFPVIRHIALNLLTEETSFKPGFKRKQKTNRSKSYLSQVLVGQGAS